MTEIRPTHCWVTRYFFPRNMDAQKSNRIIEFDDITDEAMVRAFIEFLSEFGDEVGLGDYHPIRMDHGRYLINGPLGFSVVEIDPAWTEDQIKQMEGVATTQLDLRVWGDIFHASDSQGAA